jgi:hypothetical protein
MEPQPTAGEIWRAVMAARIRSKFNAVAYAAMLGIALWQFVTGDIRTGFIVLGIIAVTYAGVPALAIFVGAFLARRKARHPKK